MRLFLASTLLALAAGTAAAQTEVPAPAGTAPLGVTAPATSPATPAGRRQPRRGDAAQAAARPEGVKPDVADSARKAQAATAARDKAWDARMKRTLGSICHGC